MTSPAVNSTSPVIVTVPLPNIALKLTIRLKFMRGNKPLSKSLVVGDVLRTTKDGFAVPIDAVIAAVVE